jgi:DUF1009 family protein
MERIGLIAGNGQFPILFAETARRQGVEVIAVAHRGETAEGIVAVASQVTWVDAGQLETMIDTLKRAGVRRAVMVGGIRKQRLFQHMRPDARATALLARLGTFKDDLVLRAVAGELEREGIAIVPSTLFLGEVVPRVGILGRRGPTSEEWRDIRYGFRVAKEIGRWDIGQCVVVRGEAVLAVEGIEGTDETIRRGGGLANGEIVVVKVCKPTQDLRFDLPAAGLGTVRTLVGARGRALALEAGRTVMLERTEMVAAADAADIAIVAVADGPGGGLEGEGFGG